MSMTITSDDMKIYNEWFVPYKYATISMIDRVFKRNQAYGYAICRKRLLQLQHENYIKVVQDEQTNTNIYMINEQKINPPSQHRLVLLSLLAELRYLGYNVERFEIEKTWMDKKYRSDALIQFTVDNLGDGKGKRYFFFVEVMTSNNFHHLDKYDTLFESGEPQQYLCKDKDFFPMVLLIADRKYTNIKLKHTKVLQLDLNLNKLSSILIS